MTICFVVHGANIVMFDSYLHGSFGALIASTTVENTENFLKAVKEMISPNCNMCSLTFVKFAQFSVSLSLIRNEINSYCRQI